MEAAQGTALLTYRLQPDRVFVSTTTSLVLEIRNDSGATVAFAPGKKVEITFPEGAGPDALSERVDYTPTSLTEGFTAARVGETSTYSVRGAGFEKRELLAGRSIQVRFIGVKVNAAPGDDVTVGVVERLALEGKASITLRKLPAGLNVVAWAERLVLGENESTMLLWESSGGTRVQVSTFADGVVDNRCPAGIRQPGYRCFPVVEPAPYRGSVEVSVPRGSTQRTYTAQVFTDTERGPAAEVTLTVHRPEITAFGVGPKMGEPEGEIGALDAVPLLWTTFYGRQALLQTPDRSSGRQVRLNPAAPFTVTPGKDAFTAAPGRVPTTAEYVLRVSGFERTAEARVCFRLKPVRVLFFKYGTMDGAGKLSDPVFEVEPRGWPGVMMVVSTPPATLAVDGPGGRQVLYLGAGDAVHPQVQYFAAADGGAGKKTLTWVTANLTALRLEPLGVDISAAQMARGTYEVAPTETTDYVLRGTAANGETITSTLKVVVG